MSQLPSISPTYLKKYSFPDPCLLDLFFLFWWVLPPLKIINTYFLTPCIDVYLLATSSAWNETTTNRINIGDRQPAGNETTTNRINRPIGDRQSASQSRFNSREPLRKANVVFGETSGNNILLDHSLQARKYLMPHNVVRFQCQKIRIVVECIVYCKFLIICSTLNFLTTFKTCRLTRHIVCCKITIGISESNIKPFVESMLGPVSVFVMAKRRFVVMEESSLFPLKTLKETLC